MVKSIAFSAACERPRMSGNRGFGVDPFDRSSVAFPARSTTLSQGRTTRHEADIQASQPEAHQQARVPGPYEDEGRPRDAEPSSPEGTRSSHRRDRLQVEAPTRSGEEKPTG